MYAWCSAKNNQPALNFRVLSLVVDRDHDDEVKEEEDEERGGGGKEGGGGGRGGGGGEEREGGREGEPSEMRLPVSCLLPLL